MSAGFPIALRTPPPGIEQNVGRRTIRECVVGQDLLAKDRINRRSLFPLR